MIMKKIICLSAAILVLAFLLVSCGEKKTSADINNTAAAQTNAQSQENDKSKTTINKKYTAGTLEYNIVHTRSLSVGAFAKPADGNFYLIIGVEIKNTGSEDVETLYSAPIATGLFGLKDEAGNDIYVLVGTGDTGGSFEADKEIATGQTEYGELMYEVPKSSTKYYLTITDDKGNNGETIEVEVKLPE